MKKLNKWINENGLLIILAILLLCFVNTCSIKNAEKKEAKYQKELVTETTKQDSILNVRFENLEHKLDSTLISNGAVISANKQTSDAINNKKQNIVIKVDK